MQKSNQINALWGAIGSSYWLCAVFFVTAAVLVVAGTLFSLLLSARLEHEEHKKMEVWAEATRQIIVAEPGANIDFAMSIIEGNQTIPVYMTDASGRFMLSRNVQLPKRLQKQDADTAEIQAYFQRKVDRLREEQEPIEVSVGQGVQQYIYHDDSTLLVLLTYFPYVNFGIVFLFLAIAVTSILTTQRAEQDRVWAGLSKETAHQLGTPISSLNVCAEMLRMQYPEEPLIPQIDKDIARLTTITDRFSKVGSVPELKLHDVGAIVKESVDYMRSRTSSRIAWQLPDNEEQPLMVMLNPTLLGWVLENLLRNAVDAMNGVGEIRIALTCEENAVCLDISDTGKGIAKRDQKRVFLPGYTTKDRGWGMGLSLCKRIVEGYHKGKIVVLRSAVGEGTTFRITLPLAA